MRHGSLHCCRRPCTNGAPKLKGHMVGKKRYWQRSLLLSCSHQNLHGGEYCQHLFWKKVILPLGLPSDHCRRLAGRYHSAALAARRAVGSLRLGSVLLMSLRIFLSCYHQDLCGGGYSRLLFREKVIVISGLPLGHCRRLTGRLFLWLIGLPLGHSCFQFPRRVTIIRGFPLRHCRRLRGGRDCPTALARRQVVGSLRPGR